ncbi:hypothetical protein [Kitasatospora azatica]|nr:hypothetical protein [Kitasatospora azatica]
MPRPPVQCSTRLPDLSPAQAADVVVDTLLRGLGAPLLAAR